MSPDARPPRPSRRDDRANRGAGGAAGRRPPGRPQTGRAPVVDAPRQVALDLLTAVRERGAYANLTLPSLIDAAGLTGRDAALATEISYGSCRMLGQLDAILDAASGRPVTELDGEIHDALRLGAYQLLHTRIGAHAAVSVTVDLVRAGRHPRGAGLVNAVLRKVADQDLAGWVERLVPAAAGDPIGRLALATAHPRWIVTAFDDALWGGRQSDEPRRHPDPELESALTADDRPPSVHLAVRPGRMDRNELADAVGGQPARYSPVGVYLPQGNPGRIRAITGGAAGVQDEGSQLVTLALAAVELDGPDRRWLDLCAGPGGKAALLGGLAAGRGAHLDAVEVTPHRADLVRSAVSGLPVDVHTVDGRDPGLAGDFDRILLDAPCTGLGALRRRPEARWRRTPADVAGLVRLQRELLASAARLVRPGGVVGYVTCSPHLSETSGVIARRAPELEPFDARPYLAGVPDLGAGPSVQLWPHRQGTDAMFLTLLRRR